MKIRFNAHDTIDTNAMTQATAGLDDATSSYENDTQLNLMKRLAKGFLAYLKGGSWADGYLKNALVAEFSDLANDSGIVPWADLEDAMVYDDKAEAEEAGE